MPVINRNGYDFAGKSINNNNNNNSQLLINQFKQIINKQITINIQKRSRHLQKCLFFCTQTGLPNNLIWRLLGEACWPPQIEPPKIYVGGLPPHTRPHILSRPPASLFIGLLTGILFKNEADWKSLGGWEGREPPESTKNEKSWEISGRSWIWGERRATGNVRCSGRQRHPKTHASHVFRTSPNVRTWGLLPHPMISIGH